MLEAVFVDLERVADHVAILNKGKTAFARMLDELKDGVKKLRVHSAREVLGVLARLAVSGPRSVRRRKGLELWYGERRTDPGSAT